MTAAKRFNGSPIVDAETVKTLTEMLGGDITDVYQEFIAAAPQELAQLKQAANDENFSKVAELAHILKGSGGNLGADSFSKLCHSVEQSAKEGSFANSDEYLAQLSQALQMTIEEFNELIK